MWFKSRRQKLIADVTAAVVDALAKQAPTAKEAPYDSVGKFYAETLGGMSSFLTQAGELALSGAMAAMGRRGGKAKARNRAERLARLAAAPKPSDCELCRDPQTRNVTVESIREHRIHESKGTTNRNGSAPEQASSGPDNGQTGEQ